MQHKLSYIKHLVTYVTTVRLSIFHQLSIIVNYCQSSTQVWQLAGFQ